MGNLGLVWRLHNIQKSRVFPFETVSHLLVQTPDREEEEWKNTNTFQALHLHASSKKVATFAVREAGTRSFY